MCKFRLLLALPLLSLALPAQVSKASVLIGDAKGHGCQGTTNPPTLTGKVLASAKLDFVYDAKTGHLTLSLQNTSPVVSGEENPLLRDLFLNLPMHTVTSVKLLSQKGQAGVKPTWSLAFDATPGDKLDDIKANCFGSFSLGLSAPKGMAGSLANPAGTMFARPKSELVVGPLVFELALTGPGTANLIAGVIANTFAQGNASAQVSVAAKFQGAGLGGEQSGMLANGCGCGGGISISGTPKVGGSFTLCTAGATGCHGCLLISTNPGPMVVYGQTIPVGMPILYAIGLPFYPASKEWCDKVNVPNNPALANLTLYFALLQLDPQTFEMSVTPGFSLTIQP